MPRLLFSSLLLFVLGLATNLKAQTGALTVQVGSPQLPPAPLVTHDDLWFWHKGTNAPQAGWKTILDTDLDATWASGPGGFGYADNTPETALCKTILSDMLGKYTTLYIRKSFTTSAASEPNAHLLLTIDYDDAFVAYLDGVELTRSTNAPGAVGTEPLSGDNATSSHESSRGTGTPPSPTTYDLGLAGSRLAPGAHVLAILGLNQTSGSSDFVLLADLAATQPSTGAAGGGPLFAIVQGAEAKLSGTNTVPGATLVMVNGNAATFDSATSAWARTNSLATGVNNFFIAATDDTGRLLAYTNRMVVGEPTFTTVGGAISADTQWSPAMGVLHVTNSVAIAPGSTLTIEAGTTLLMTPGAKIIGTNATLRATGTRERPVYFLPADGTSLNWGGLVISGTNGVMQLAHVETIAGYVELLDGAVGTLRDSFFHDYLVASPPIIHTLGVPNRVTLNMERCHLARYHEILAQQSTNRLSDCLLEYLDYSGDGIDFDNGQEGSYIRSCTVRRGTVFNTDAIDMGEYGAEGTHVLIDSCLLHDFIDKGISMGVGVTVSVTNTLIYNVDSGFGVKDNSVAGIFNCTVANANYGIRAYNKANSGALTGGGHVTNSFNNIFWNFTNAAVSLANGSTLDATYSDFQGTNFTGFGNLSADPLFVNPAANDFRVRAGSPTIGAGFGGANLGVMLPVGGIPATPLALSAVAGGYDAPVVAWLDDADNETEFVIERSNGIEWIVIGNVAANVTQFVDATTTAGQKYYYRVLANNSAGRSDYSNVASAARRALNLVLKGNIGGVISVDTILDADATFTVTNSLTVAPGTTLTIRPGAQVLFNAGLNMVVNDGAKLLAEGTAAAPILFSRAGTSGNWGNLTINGSVGSLETKISYARFEFNAAASSRPAIEVDGGTVTLDHLTFGETTSPYVHLDRASFVVSNCEFPTCTLPVGFELLHGTGGIKAGGRGIIRHSYFGSTTNYSDVIDFTGGNRPAPIIQIFNNVFIGSGDDLLDFDGTDAWVEGNIFLHAHKNGSPDTASAISGGSDSGQVSEITVIGNLFFDCDQAATAKQGNFYTLLNNTIVHMTNAGGTDTASAVINVGEEGATPGAGMYSEGNVVVDAGTLVRNYAPPTTLVTFNNNILPAAWTGPGSGNLVANPLLKHVPTVSEATFTNWTAAQVMWDWFSLQAGSPAIGAGPNASDMGGVIANGVFISGEPPARTTSRSATLLVGPNRTGAGISTNGWPLGSGFTSYKWRLDTNSWSPEISLSDPIVLSGLADGPHHVEVVGRNDAGLFQDDSELGEDAVVTVSRTWIVEPGLTFASIQRLGADVHLHFTAEAGTTYRIEYKNDLNEATWSKLTDVSAQAVTGDYDVVDAAPAGQSRFYRIVTPAIP